MSAHIDHLSYPKSNIYLIHIYMLKTMLNS